MSRVKNLMAAKVKKANKARRTAKVAGKHSATQLVSKSVCFCPRVIAAAC